MFSGLTKIIAAVMTALPVIDKILPAVRQVADATPWKWDDKAVDSFEKGLGLARKVLGDVGAQTAQQMGLRAAVTANEAGLTLDETQKAIDDGLKLAARAKDIRKGFRQQLIQGIPVVLGDRTLTTIADLKAIPDSTFRLLAEASYNAAKLDGGTTE